MFFLQVPAIVLQAHLVALCPYLDNIKHVLEVTYNAISVVLITCVLALTQVDPMCTAADGLDRAVRGLEMTRLLLALLSGAYSIFIRVFCFRNQVGVYEGWEHARRKPKL